MKKSFLSFLILVLFIPLVVLAGDEEPSGGEPVAETPITIDANNMQKVSEGDNYQKILAELAKQYSYRYRYQKYNSYNTFLFSASDRSRSVVGLESYTDYFRSYQRIKSLYAPEEANAQHMLFNDCSGFMYTMYNEAFCYGITDDYYTMGTVNAANSYIEGNSNSNYWNETPVDNWSNDWNNDNGLVFYYKTTEADQDQAEQMKKIKYIMDNIQIGDIIASIKYECTPSGGTCNNRTHAANAHMMMYVGNGKYVDYGSLTDYYHGNFIINKYNTKYSYSYIVGSDENGYAPVSLKTAKNWWAPEGGTRPDGGVFYDGYLFYNVTKSYQPGTTTSKITYVGELAVIRPLNVIRNNSNYTACYQKSLNRLNFPELEVTKLSTLYDNNDVSKCDEVTYTVELFNHSNNTYTVPVKNTISENAKLISGSLNADVVVGPNEKKTMSYTVSLNENAKTGEYLVTEGTAGGVKLNTLKNRISSNLSKTQQKAMSDVVYSNSFDTPVEMISAVYKKLYNYNKFDGKNVDDFINSAFDVYEVNEANYLAYNQKSEFANDDLGKMVMKGLYGGYFVFTKKGEANKPGDFRLEFLQPGDILTYISYSGTYSSRQDMNLNVNKDSYIKNVYLYLGDSTFATIKSGRLAIIDSTVDYDGDISVDTFVTGLRGDVAYAVHRPSVLFEDNACASKSIFEVIEDIPKTSKTSILTCVGLVLAVVGAAIYGYSRKKVKEPKKNTNLS